MVWNDRIEEPTVTGADDFGREGAGRPPFEGDFPPGAGRYDEAPTTEFSRLVFDDDGAEFPGPRGGPAGPGGQGAPGGMRSRETRDPREGRDSREVRGGRDPRSSANGNGNGNGGFGGPGGAPGMSGLGFPEPGGRVGPGVQQGPDAANRPTRPIRPRAGGGPAGPVVPPGSAFREQPPQLGAMDGRGDGRMDGRVDGRVDGRMMDGRVDGRMDGRGDGRVDGRMDGRVDGRGQRPVGQPAGRGPAARSQGSEQRGLTLPQQRDSNADSGPTRRSPGARGAEALRQAQKFDVFRRDPVVPQQTSPADGNDYDEAADRTPLPPEARDARGQVEISVFDGADHQDHSGSFDLRSPLPTPASYDQPTDIIPAIVDDPDQRPDSFGRRPQQQNADARGYGAPQGFPPAGVADEQGFGNQGFPPEQGFPPAGVADEQGFANQGFPPANEQGFPPPTDQPGFPPQPADEPAISFPSQAPNPQAGHGFGADTGLDPAATFGGPMPFPPQAGTDPSFNSRQGFAGPVPEAATGLGELRSFGPNGESPLAGPVFGAPEGGMPSFGDRPLTANTGPNYGLPLGDDDFTKRVPDFPGAHFDPPRFEPAPPVFDDPAEGVEFPPGPEYAQGPEFAQDPEYAQGAEYADYAAQGAEYPPQGAEYPPQGAEFSPQGAEFPPAAPESATEPDPGPVFATPTVAITPAEQFGEQFGEYQEPEAAAPDDVEEDADPDAEPEMLVPWAAPAEAADAASETAAPAEADPYDETETLDPQNGVPDDDAPRVPPYDDAELAAVHRVIRERRDVRSTFLPDAIPDEVLHRVLEAAHTAPSVGFSQPWDFLVLRSRDTRQAVHELAARQRDAYSASLPKARQRAFRDLKIEAILDTPVNIVVTCDPTRGGRHTLGRHTQPQMAPYSAALAVENLWLAARAEGLGVGWVSFFDERELTRTLDLPDHLTVVAYLCVGYVREFPEEPELSGAGWAKRRPLAWAVHEEQYGRRALPGSHPVSLLDETLAAIAPLDAAAQQAAVARQAVMTKPAGSLGVLEEVSIQLSGLAGVCPPPVPEPAAVAVFAADHGVHAQGVTPWPQEVTAQMVHNFLAGGAVVNAFASQIGAEVCVVDVGVNADLPQQSGLVPRKIRYGTADLAEGPAMSREEALAALEVGVETARDLVAAGNKVLLTGDMGIANTTASAALIAAFTGASPAQVTGYGTGIDEQTYAHKVEVVRRALDLHRPDPADPLGVLAAVGGLEHAALAGFILGAASLRTPVILDGVIAGAAALVAQAMAPEATAAMVAGHRSAESGHQLALEALGVVPLIDLELRLGEGSGAVLALPLVQASVRALRDVATFESAGVAERDGEDAAGDR